MPRKQFMDSLLNPLTNFLSTMSTGPGGIMARAVQPAIRAVREAQLTGGWPAESKEVMPVQKTPVTPKRGRKNSSTPNSDKNRATTQAVASTPGSISRQFQGTISHLGNPIKGDPMYITPSTKKNGAIKADTSGLKAEKPMAAELTKKQMRKAKRVERLENRMATQRKKGVEATSDGRFIDAKNKNNRISNLQKRIDRKKSRM